MKKAALLLIIFLMAGVLTQRPAGAGGVDDFELVKGVAVISADGTWDGVDFQVLTKNGKISIPVISVNLLVYRNNSQYLIPVEFNKTEINKRTEEYSIDLSSLEFSEDFQLLIKVDLSELLSGTDDGSDSGPGPIPNETVLIIKYP